MNQLNCLIFLTLIAFAVGCKTSQRSTTATPIAPASAPAPAPELAPVIMVPRITMVHVEQRFVVIDFSTQVMPAIGKRLNVFRDGKRQGEVQITDPVRARFATADILSGELRVGDEVR